ncbi:hydrolase, alpha/beta domain protein [Gleimia coleocanis DSM 15436]|uniref:Hydrolase, alpha/beta domain protein n=1 Tax=Gleimia coleocanis DSM 15436 TaxID=525245 RepID=C0W1F6_9ACTO|nr:alpha/beta fold hydrolase [Gleimia coleocanis]EEH63322.1 hydrolase, alpha/beta domain protein [Gleimia coleocanis DSM 15436]
MSTLNIVEARRDESVAPLVLIHALGADASSFTEVVAALDYPHVLLVDLPGHGGSAPLDLEGAATAGAIWNALLSSLASLGVEKFHLAGVSIGGALTWYGAVHHADRLLSVTVLCAGPVNLPSEMWIERAALVRAEGVFQLVEPTLRRWFTPDFLEGGASAVERTRQSYLSVDPEGYAQCCEVLASLDLRGMPVGDIPFQVGTGEFDEGFTVSMLHEAVLSLAEQTMVFGFVIEDAAHQVVVEQPQLVAKYLQAHLCDAV